MEEGRSLLPVIAGRQKTGMGHILRGGRLLKDVTEGRYEGKRLRGRRKAMPDDSKIGKSCHDMKKGRAEDREVWRELNP